MSDDLSPIAQTNQREAEDQTDQEYVTNYAFSRNKPKSYTSAFEKYNVQLRDEIGKVKNNYFFSYLAAENAEKSNGKPDFNLYVGQVVYVWNYKYPVVILGFQTVGDRSLGMNIVVRFFSDEENYLKRAFAHPNGKAAMPSKSLGYMMKITVFSVIKIVKKAEGGIISAIADYPEKCYDQVEAFFQKRAGLNRQALDVDTPVKKKRKLNSDDEGSSTPNKTKDNISTPETARTPIISPYFSQEARTPIIDTPNRNFVTQADNQLLSPITPVPYYPQNTGMMNMHNGLGMANSFFTDIVKLMDDRASKNEQHFERCLAVMESSRLRQEEERTKQMELKLQLLAAKANLPARSVSPSPPPASSSARRRK